MKNRDLPIGVKKEIRENRQRYLALWYENGKQKSKSFNIKKYGDETAYKLAYEFRKQKEIELNIYKHENIYIDKGSYYVLKIKNPSCEVDVLFDLCDFDKISNYYWYIDNTHVSKSVKCKVNNRTKDIRSIIFSDKYHNNVIYKNKNNLDNRRSNLLILNSNNADSVSHRQISPRNTSSKTGVYKHSYSRIYNEQKFVYEYWVACWGVGNKTYSKSFSTKKYGDDEAFKLASEYRDKMAEKFGIYNA